MFVSYLSVGLHNSKRHLFVIKGYTALVLTGSDINTKVLNLLLPVACVCTTQIWQMLFLPFLADSSQRSLLTWHVSNCKCFLINNYNMLPVKKSLYNQPKPYFFKNLLWSHFWIDFILTNFTPKHSKLFIFWLFICSLYLYEWFLFVHNINRIVNF